VFLLKAEKLTHYFGGLCAVSDFNLDLNPGELIGIIGPNGAGKTTVFNLITGVYKPTSGRFFFEGKDITKKSPHERTVLGIARTFQNIRLFKELSVLENIKIAFFAQALYGPLEALFHFGRYRSEESRITDRSLELLEIFKLDMYAGEKSKNLPYGLQRRLEIARALATGPKLLLLDEPAAGMNPNEIEELMEFIGWIRQKFNLTIVLIEHQMRLVMGICERLEVLDFGATICRGTPRIIQNDPKVLEAYLGEEIPS
jgi:branched-chain amino acid transport system ATP-binding protein